MMSPPGATAVIPTQLGEVNKRNSAWHGRAPGRKHCSGSGAKDSHHHLKGEKGWATRVLAQCLCDEASPFLSQGKLSLALCSPEVAEASPLH